MVNIPLLRLFIILISTITGDDINLSMDIREKTFGWPRPPYPDHISKTLHLPLLGSEYHFGGADQRQ